MNNKYNNFMEKLDTSEEFKKQLIDKINKEEIKKESFKFKIQKKIISIISALAILSAGGTVFAVTMPEEWKNAVKEFFGIISNEQYEETKIEVNETKESNDYSLTLENYGIDSENLLITYNLKTAKEIDLSYPFREEPDYIYHDNIEIIDLDSNNIIFNTDSSSTEDKFLIHKINNLEYQIYEIYSLNPKILSNNCILNIDFELLELNNLAQDLEYTSLGNFKFEIPIEKDKINLEYQKYDIKNKTITLHEKLKYLKANGEIVEDISKLDITQIINTNLTTKIMVNFDGLGGIRRDYTLDIIDEKNNTILEKNLEYVYRYRRTRDNNYSKSKHEFKTYINFIC